jgi:uncharacterized protein (DUF924 family)
MSSINTSAIDFRKRVLKFWFSNNRWSSLDNPPAKSAPIDESDGLRWFSPSKEFDKQVRENFEDDLPHLVNDDYRYPGDITHPEHLLACIIALDQFPRNIYRHDARAYSYDYKAKELSKFLIANQSDKQLPYIERAFINLPFEHSENLEDQNIAVEYSQQLYDEAKNDPTSNEDVCNFIKYFVKASKQHQEIIKQFGRFPHRNAVLKRESLENEDIYLRNGGERFGQ